MPSAGGSGGINASNPTPANAPTLGPPQNNYIPAECNGTTQFLACGQLGQITNFAGTECTGFVLCQPDSVTQNSASSWNNNAIFADAAAFWGLFLKNPVSPQLVAYCWTGSQNQVLITLPGSLSQYFLFQTRFGSSVLEARINGGPWSTVATPLPNIGTTSGSLQLGGTSFFFDGRILAAFGFQRRISDVDANLVLEWCRRRYNLPLL